MTAQAADVVATVMNNDNRVLRHCWLGGSKGIWPVKKERWGAGVVVSLEHGPADATATHCLLLQ